MVSAMNLLVHCINLTLRVTKRVTMKPYKYYVVGRDIPNYFVYRINSQGTLQFAYGDGWGTSLTDTIKSIRGVGYIEVSENKARLIFNLSRRHIYRFDTE